ncbi:transglycosylase SLT domain-containing protein [Acidovorax sp. A1169]|uniref:transglycosylase SLT domain-containing protein n=1 Tax=Acidovorax sp. A1169 TaxID=3059524 RepID=UPI0027378DB4|nr:transglycosylase SLT domain-containing protein [Acidovorax sp. A1169]MDP4078189.1 transglycosylase SLT domain-containing protein [Acidovorax sp. A1169]
MKIVHIACLAGMLWLTGCATTGTDTTVAGGASDGPATPTNNKAPARPAHTPLIPNGPLQPIMAVNTFNGGGVASLSAPADLWDRIRRGFAMPDLQHELVQDREQWYATRPDYIQRMTERSSKYLFHIVEELERRGMPTELALLPYIESAFNPQAVSSAKAAGMWQFMPATGNYFDLKQNAFRDDRRDVLASTRAALDYLQKLHGMFGDWHLALAAYNWGEGSVGRAIARNQKAGLGTSYTDLNMPAETRLYVPKLQAVKNIVANPDAFKAELPLIENHPYFQTVDITHDIDVALVATLSGIREDDFRALNPSYKRPVILAAGTPQILLPWDNAKVFQRNLEARREGQYASWTVWSVPTTMTVADAAQRTGMSEADLRAMNNIPPRMLIKAGSALMVPRSVTTREDVSSHLADNGQLAFAPEIVTRRTTVRARKGETVASVARRYNLAAASVADWNDVKASAAFKLGQQIVVYLPVRAATAAAATQVRSSNVRNVVQARGKQSAAKAPASAPAKRGGTPSKVKKR